MARYESDITLFLKQLKKDQPELESGQLAGRDRLWDKAQDSIRCAMSLSFISANHFFHLVTELMMVGITG